MIPHLFDSLLGHGLWFIVPSDDPRMYPFVIAALVLSALCIVIWFVREMRDDLGNGTSLAVALGQNLLIVVLAAVLLSGTTALLWRAFASPIASLPFIRTTGVLTYVGVVVRGVVELFCIQFLIGIWMYLVRIEPTSRLGQFLTMVSTLVAVAGWETQLFPLWYLLPGESLLGIGLSTVVPKILLGSPDRAKSGPPARLRRYRRSGSLYSALVLLVTFIAVICAHDIQAYLINVVGLYFGLIQLDEVAAAGIGLFRLHQRNPQQISPRRWLVTVPLVLVLTIVAASGFFQPVLANTSLDYNLWVGVGTATAAYMLFKPLIDLARFAASKRAEQQMPEGVLAAALNRFGDYVERGLLLPQQRAGQGGQKEADERKPAPAELQVQEPASGQRFTVPHVFKDLPVSEMLNFPTGLIFLLTLLVYHVLIVNLNFGGQLNSGLVPLVFGLTALVAGMLQLVSSPVLESPRYVSMLLVFVIIVVTGLTVLLNVAPTGHAAFSLAGRSPVSLLTDSQYYVATLHQFLQEFLVVLTIGQLGYIYRVVDFAIGAEQQELKDRNEDGWDELANTLYDDNDFEGAIRAYKEALKRDPENDTLWRRMGVAYELSEHYPEALDAYERAHKLQSEEPRYLVDIGDAHARMGQFQQALDAYESALQLAPATSAVAASGWNGKGNVYDAQQHYAQAVEAYDRALESTPDSALIWTNEGDTLMRMQKPTEALHAFEQALRHDDKSSRAWNGKGNALFDLGDNAQAVTAYDRALRLAPGNAVLLSNKGNALRRLGKWTDALRAYESALRTDENAADIWMLKGNVLLDLERWTDAEQAFTRATELDPSLLQAWTGKSVALREQKRLPDALAASERALNVDAHSPDALNSKAYVLMAMGQYEQALTTIDEAIRQAPSATAGYYWDSKGEIYLNMGRYTDAVAAYDEAIRQAPSPQASWLENSWKYKASALRALGRAEEAQAAQAQAVAVGTGRRTT
jgi:tetratricopeptide (TPR) repeat protein